MADKEDDEFALEPEEPETADSAATMVLEQDEDEASTADTETSGGETGMTEEVTEELGMEDADDANDDAEDEENAEEEVEDEPAEVVPVVTVSEGSSIGAFTGMLIIAFFAYCAAAAVVWYRISEYSTPGAFPWNTPMP